MTVVVRVYSIVDQEVVSDHPADGLSVPELAKLIEKLARSHPFPRFNVYSFNSDAAVYRATTTTQIDKNHAPKVMVSIQVESPGIASENEAPKSTVGAENPSREGNPASKTRNSASLARTPHRTRSRAQR